MGARSAPGTRRRGWRSSRSAEPAFRLTQTLVAFDPEDGHHVWEAPLPDSVNFVAQAGSHLVGMSRDLSSVVVLG